MGYWRIYRLYYLRFWWWVRRCHWANRIDLNYWNGILLFFVLSLYFIDKVKRKAVFFNLSLGEGFWKRKQQSVCQFKFCMLAALNFPCLHCQADPLLMLYNKLLLDKPFVWRPILQFKFHYQASRQVMGLWFKIKASVTSCDMKIDCRTRQILYRDQQLSSLSLYLLQSYLFLPQFQKSLQIYTDRYERANTFRLSLLLD